MRWRERGHCGKAPDGDSRLLLAQGSFILCPMLANVAILTVDTSAIPHMPSRDAVAMCQLSAGA